MRPPSHDHRSSSFGATRRTAASSHAASRGVRWYRAACSFGGSQPRGGSIQDLARPFPFAARTGASPPLAHRAGALAAPKLTLREKWSAALRAGANHGFGAQTRVHGGRLAPCSARRWCCSRRVKVVHSELLRRKLISSRSRRCRSVAHVAARRCVKKGSGAQPQGAAGGGAQPRITVC